jgi:DNA-binding Lrp family transcriptional regulator
VLKNLQQHPDVEHSPTAVAKTLGRSAGAVSNALDRLAADGTIVQTSQKPRRFTAART